MTCQEVEKLILKNRPGEIRALHAPVKGGYNITYRLEYEDGISVIMRDPIPGRYDGVFQHDYHPELISTGVVPFPEEKTRNEVATMR